MNDPIRHDLATELLDAVKGVLEFERLNSVISGPYDRMRLAYNAVIREANLNAVSESDADPVAALLLDGFWRTGRTDTYPHPAQFTYLRDRALEAIEAAGLTLAAPEPTE